MSSEIKEISVSEWYDIREENGWGGDGIFRIRFKNMDFSEEDGWIYIRSSGVMTGSNCRSYKIRVDGLMEELDTLKRVVGL